MRVTPAGIRVLGAVVAGAGPASLRELRTAWSLSRKGLVQFDGKRWKLTGAGGEFWKGLDRSRVMSKTTYPQLTEEQLVNLHAFAAKHGRNWKSALRDVWDRSNPRDNTEAMVYPIRNTHGPRWLNSFKLPSQLWHFEWKGGGYNSVTASSFKEALALATEMGQPSKDGRGMTVTLVPNESTLRPVTADESIKIDRKWASLCD